MIRSLIILFISLYSMNAYAQSKTWIGLNIGYNKDHFQVNNPDGTDKKSSANIGSASIIIEHKLSDLFYIGSGINIKPYQDNIEYRQIPNYYTSTDIAFNSGQIPLYLKAEKLLKNEMVSVHLFGGGNFVYNFDYASGTTTNSGSYTLFNFITGTSTEVLLSTETQIKRTFFTLIGGGGIQFPILKNCKIGLQVFRTIGLEEALTIEHEVSENGVMLPQSEVFSKGSYTATAVQFFYNFKKSK